MSELPDEVFCVFERELEELNAGSCLGIDLIRYFKNEYNTRELEAFIQVSSIEEILLRCAANGWVFAGIVPDEYCSAEIPWEEFLEDAKYFKMSTLQLFK